MARAKSDVSWKYYDGGRAAAGLPNSKRGDCVCRAIAIVTGYDYLKIAAFIDQEAQQERNRRNSPRYTRSSAEKGVKTHTLHRVMKKLGFRFIPTIAVGTGCQVHLHPSELPPYGRYVLRVTHHVVAFINGIVYDTHDPSRNGTRCVYGIWVWDGAGKGSVSL